MSKERAADYAAGNIQKMIDSGVIPSRAAFNSSYLRDAGNIPTSSEQKQKLGRIRMKRLRIIKIMNILIMLTSIPAIVVGALLIIKSSQFPYKIGGGLISGSGVKWPTSREKRPSALFNKCRY